MEELLSLAEYWIDLSKKIGKKEDSLDLLELAGMENQETLYSRILWTILSMDKRSYRKEFLKMLVSAFSKEQLQTDEIIEVYREALTYDENGNEGFVDVLLKTRDENVIVLENKLDAGDRPRQLTRYLEHFERNGFKGKVYLVYLTKTGYLPSEDSLCTARREELEKNGRFACISYKKDIISWLDIIIQETEQGPLAAGLIQFQTTIKDMLNMYDEEMKIVKSEFQKLDNLDMEKLTIVKNALDLMIHVKKDIAFYEQLAKQMPLEIPGFDAERLFYMCNQKCFSDALSWEKEIIEHDCTYYGLIYSYGTDMEIPCYGIALESQGNSETYNSHSYFGVYKGPQKTNHQKLFLPMKPHSTEGESSFWGDLIDFTRDVNDQEFAKAIDFFKQAIEANRGK